MRCFVPALFCDTAVAKSTLVYQYLYDMCKFLSAKAWVHQWLGQGPITQLLLLLAFCTLVSCQEITPPGRSEGGWSPLSVPDLLYPQQNPDDYSGCQFTSCCSRPSLPLKKSKTLLLLVDKRVPGLLMLIQAFFTHTKI